MVVPLGAVRPRIPERPPVQIACHAGGQTTLATTDEHVVVGGAAVVTGGFAATSFGFTGGAGGVRTRTLGTTAATRRVRIGAGRGDDSDRREIGAPTAAVGLAGASAAPVSAATRTSAAASATTKPTTASGLPNHIQWLSTRAHRG